MEDNATNFRCRRLEMKARDVVAPIMGVLLAVFSTFKPGLLVSLGVLAVCLLLASIVRNIFSKTVLTGCVVAVFATILVYYY